MISQNISTAEAGNKLAESKRRPTVTAIVPCYNSGVFISKTLDCLAAQTWANLEILIGDDCSIDNTLAVVTAFAEGRGDVRIVTQQHNLGWLKNCNDLMGRANTEFLFFAFHDDLVAPTYVERLASALEASPSAVLAYSDMEVTDVEGIKTLWTFEKLAGLQTVRSRGLAMARRPDGWWVPNRGLFRREAFDSIGGIKPSKKGEISADWAWLLHMALLGDFVRVPEVLCFKFYMKQSLSLSWTTSWEEKRAVRRAGIREVMRSEIALTDKVVLVWHLARPDIMRPYYFLRRSAKPLVARLR